MNNSEPLLDLLGIISPITNSTCGASDSPALACAVAAVFYSYISLICRSLYTVGNVAEIGSCLDEIVSPPWNTVLSSIFGGISQGALTTAEKCPITFDIWNSNLDPLCPLIFDPIFNIMEASSVGGPSGLTCESEEFTELACTIIEGYSITERILCALDSTAINVVTFATCLVDRLPIAGRNVLL